MKKIEMAKRLYEISKEMDALEDEKKELREALAEKMDAGEILPFETPEGPYRMKNTQTNTRILWENEVIHRLIGSLAFEKAATISSGKLETALKAVHSPDLAPELLRGCTKAWTPGTCLKLLKGRE